MTYDYLKNLKSTNLTLKLLNSDNFAMSLAFFHFAFVQKRNITLNHSAILLYLDDFLYDINQTYTGAFPKSAKEYLEDFSHDRSAYLRKYHGSDDEALFELTPHAQKALEFIESLEKKEFIGSRSKFNIIFELLEELEFETNLSDRERIKKLEAQKKALDAQIEAIKTKQDLRFDSSRIKEHFMQIDEMVRKLKYDFSEIEYNFRDLNTVAMEQIAIRDDGKGDVLGSIFDIEDKIRQSDQGKSFFAFWQLLTDASRNQKLSALLENLYRIPTISDFDQERKLKDMKYNLLKSGEKIYTVSSKLIEQLRRFLDDRVWIENRRILELSKAIEQRAIEIKEVIPPQRNFMMIKGDRVKAELPFSRPLYTLKVASEFKKELIEHEITLDLDSFYHQFFIDEAALKRNIAQILLHTPQCSIADIVKKFEVSKGIGELIGYISIAKNSQNVRIETDVTQEITITDFDGYEKRIRLPKIIFIKESR